MILRPLCTDSTGYGRYRFTSMPASASLYNKPELSDIRIIVGDNSYYAHKLILCAASEVFKNMLDERWVESNRQELKLEEEDDCTKYFEIFLQYVYTGSVVISESYVLPLYILADKYMVKALYNECVKIIESGLKVYLVTKSDAGRARPRSNAVRFHSRRGVDIATSSMDELDDSRYKQLPLQGYNPGSSSSDESTDTYMSDDDLGPPVLAKIKQDTPVTCHDNSAGVLPHFNLSQSNSTYLVASETFPLPTITKMLLFCQNARIKEAALYNLEARLSKQLVNQSYGFWNDIPRDIIVMMLEDDCFYCNEFVIFEAVKSWLEFNNCTQSVQDLDKLLTLVRYPTLTNQELYRVDKDPIVQHCLEAKRLIQEAIRYQLFKDCCTAADRDKWNTRQYQVRTVKQQD